MGVVLTAGISSLSWGSVIFFNPSLKDIYVWISANGYADPVRVVPFEDLSNPVHPHVPIVRGVKRRNTANKKERRRTQSINAAFQDLRDRIPNVPSDTKLSKVRWKEK